jgi:hypothetical protein
MTAFVVLCSECNNMHGVINTQLEKGMLEKELRLNQTWEEKNID